MNNLRKKKKKKNIIDFNDIEHFCLKILTEKDKQGGIIPSLVALKLREKYDEILIDEYQDSNLVQDFILGTVSRKDSENPNLFMVGDVKQSIYKFRQAKPELFLEKYRTYSDNEGDRSRKILLYKNFRSRKEIIYGTNFIFKQIMSQDIGELNYNDREALNVGADYIEHGDLIGITGGAIELNIIEKKEKEIFELNINEEDEEQVDNIRLEARLVCQRINQLLRPISEENTFKVFDKQSKQYRKVEYKDIVILLRATSAWSPVFVEELKAASIPVYADTGTGYFDTIEIKTILSLLQIIDNPLQDIPLLAVLRSPIASFSAEELIDIRMIDSKVTYYEALKKAADLSVSPKGTDDEIAIGKEGASIEEFKEEYMGMNVCFSGVQEENIINLNDVESMDEYVYNSQIIHNEGIKQCNEDEFYNKYKIDKKLCIKASYFLKTLNYLRERSLHMPIDEFIWHLYTSTGYYGYVAAMSGGVQRQANLRVLFQRAKQYEQISYKGLFNFVNFINRLKVSSGDMGSAKILGENENVVRIMSIHKSKGLEFPVVILSGTGKNFNLMDMNKSVLFHHSLGFGPDYVDYERRIAYPTIIKQAIRKKIKIESLSEEMRILYVALTRAKEKLIITGAVQDLKKSVKKWSGTLIEKGRKEFLKI